MNSDVGSEFYKLDALREKISVDNKTINAESWFMQRSLHNTRKLITGKGTDSALWKERRRKRNLVSQNFPKLKF